MAYTTIDKSSLHFNTKLYTGNSSTNAQTGVGFTPSLTWIKTRNTSGYAHVLVDAVRGVTKELRSSGDNAEITTTNSFTSFDSDGFTLGADSGDNYNKTSNTYCSWNWKANGAGSSNTDGSITSTVSANTTAGFSIVKYTGTGSNATVGHGLGSAPSVIIQKKTSASATWLVKHPGIGTNGYIRLDSTAASATDSAIWNNTDPTSTVFSIGTDATINASGATSVAYCFAEKKGFSKFGSYEGNLSTNGSFINTGFKPAFVMMKGIDSGGSDNWNLCDNKRVGYNAANWRLYPNATAGENTTSLVDLLSNGFKLRVNSTDVNADAKTYIYMAFAEAPLVGSNNVPATAR